MEDLREAMNEVLTTSRWIPRVRLLRVCVYLVRVSASDPLAGRPNFAGVVVVKEEL